MAIISSQPASNSDMAYKICSVCGGKGTINKSVDCPYCKDSGSVACSSCGGKGNYICTSCGGEGQYSCSSCAGQGYYICSSCAGLGYVPRKHNFREHVLEDFEPVKTITYSQIFV